MNIINKIAKILSRCASPSRLFVGLAILAVAGVSNATILTYEPFNYPLGAIGAPVSTATGVATATTGGGYLDWFSGGAGNSMVAGLTYPGLQVSANALQWGTAINYGGENLATPITPAAYGTVYVSFLFNTADFSAGNGHTGFALDAGGGANLGYYLGMTSSGTIGLAEGDAAAGAVLAACPETINFGTTYFVVVKLVKNTAGTYYQSGAMWINPTPGGVEPAASATFSGTYTQMTKIQAIITVLGGSVAITDEIRMGTTWADVTVANGATPPDTPTGLTVDSVQPNTVNLSWTAATGSPLGYNIHRAPSGGPWTVVGSTTEPTVTFSDSVTGGQLYWYTVSAFNGGGESAESSAVSATPPLALPDPPTGLTGIPTDSQVIVNWIAPAVGAPTSYNVKRSTTSGSGYVTIGTTTVPTTQYIDTPLVNGTPYYYVVAAVNGTGEGANSTELSVTPNISTGSHEPFDYPAEDNLLTGATGSGSGFGTWSTAPGTWILTGSHAYPGMLNTSGNRMRQAIGGRATVPLITPVGSGTQWIAYLWEHSPGDPGGNFNGAYFPNGGTGLYVGLGYPYSGTEGYFGLSSTDTTGLTPMTVANLVKTTATYPYGGVKLIVLKIDFNTSGNNDTVTLYVNPVANQLTPGIPASAIYASFDVGTIAGMGTQCAGGGDFSTDEWAIADTYVDAVKAVVIPPDTPTGLGAVAGTNSVALSWNPAGGGAPVSYNIWRATSSGGTYTTIGTKTAPGVTYTDTIIGGQTYYYKVSAVNAIGESAASAYVSASPAIAPPDTPSLSGSEGDSLITLNWSAETFATNYDVKRSDTFGGTYTSIVTTGALTYDDTDVFNAVTKWYQVAAYGAGGWSAYSAPKDFTPFGPLPLVLDMDVGVGLTFFASNSVEYHVEWADVDLGSNTVWNVLTQPTYGDEAMTTVFDPVKHNVYRVIGVE